MKMEKNICRGYPLISVTDLKEGYYSEIQRGGAGGYGTGL